MMELKHKFIALCDIKPYFVNEIHPILCRLAKEYGFREEYQRLMYSRSKGYKLNSKFMLINFLYDDLKTFFLLSNNYNFSCEKFLNKPIHIPIKYFLTDKKCCALMLVIKILYRIDSIEVSDRYAIMKTMYYLFFPTFKMRLKKCIGIIKSL